MLSIGYDIGSSSIKCSILEIENGKVIAEDFYPVEEMRISSPYPGWAEQDPNMWWENVKILTKQLLKNNNIDGSKVVSIGISYQMHGLVLVDKNQNVLRPSIIWCDSRAVEIGNKAFNKIGSDYCLNNLLNSPGNFTASKLRWVKENEPDVYSRIYKAMLPGDFIAMKLTGEINSTISGLSEGIFWDFKNHNISAKILSNYEIDEKILPDIHPTFAVQGKITADVAAELGLNKGTFVSYRAGDQPNNAFSLNVINSGEIAATAGTSGVIYGVMDKINCDKLSRVNQFAHVNYTVEQPRFGVLLCINGTGIQNSWVRKQIAGNLSYDYMNKLAYDIPVGSEGVCVIPFGNGAERVLENKNVKGQILGLDFNRHTSAHLFRASQEGIAFSLKYGLDIMKEMGLKVSVIRAGKANMFLSPVFRETLSNVTEAMIELYDTNGAQGAARGAAYGAGYYKTFKDTLQSLNKVGEVHPKVKDVDITLNAYNNWLSKLKLFC
jgi:xylulokinase